MFIIIVVQLYMFTIIEVQLYKLYFLRNKQADMPKVFNLWPNLTAYSYGDVFFFCLL